MVEITDQLKKFLKVILNDEQEQALKNFMADRKSGYKASDEDIYADAKGMGMYRYLNESKGGVAFNKGGAVMQDQMEMAFMDDGGLKDDGGEVEPTSGNDVPSGSLKEEVKDDIPTMLSEGEFVFPADVVRYIGLEKLMNMRQQAKMGLKKMEAMGQMGDEPTMPDDLPFGMADLVVIAGGKDDEDAPREMQTGGLTGDSPQFRTLESPQEVPIRSGRRNIQLPTIPNLDDEEDEDDIDAEIDDILNEEDEDAIEEEMGGVDISDRGYAQSKPEDKGIAKPFKQYRGEEFDAAADSYTNLGAKVLSYTPLGMLSDIPYNSGKAVAKKALEEGKWSDEVLEMKNPFKSDLEPAVRKGAAITEWEKAALVKYLTVDRPKNSIFQSVSNLIGKAFGKEVQEDKKTKGPDEDILKFLKDKKLITIDPSTNKISVMLDGKAVLLENVDKWMDTWKEKNKPAPPTSAEQNAIRQFDNVGFVSNFGADSGGQGGLNLQFMGDVGGTGASRMDIFRIDDGTGQDVKFVRRYELENAGIDTSDTLAVLNALKSFKETGQIKANPIVTNSVNAEEIEMPPPRPEAIEPIEPSDDYNIGDMGEFDTSPVTGPIQDPSEIPTPSPTPDYANPTLGLDPYSEREGPPDTGNPFSRPIQGDPIVEMGDFDQTDAVDPYAPIPMATSGKTADYMAGIKPTVTDPTVTPFDEKDRFPKVGPELDLSGIPSLQPDSLDAFGGAGPDIDIPDPVSSVDTSIQDAKKAAKKAKEEAARLEAQAEERRRRRRQEARDKAARDAVAKTNFGKAKEEAKKDPFADLSKFGGGRAKGGLAKMKTKPTAKRKGGLASKKK